MTEVRVVPLGGLGEIGLNMMVLETAEEALVIDCGLMFPEPHMPGIDIVIPDFTYLHENPRRLLGVVVTHGHEDHIGALPFFLRRFPVPVWGTSLTLGLIDAKLEEHELQGKVELKTVSRGDRVEIGPFSLRFLHVCHSIPDSSALAIETLAGLIVHSGDFKFDDTPVDGKRPDYAGLARCGDEGVLLLLSDSTNVEQKGESESEATLEPAFEEAFATTEGRLYFSLFSSNLNRIQQIIDKAQQHGRKVVLVGRSLVTNCRVAVERGYLRVDSRTLIDVKGARNHPPHELAVITTGSQGEPMSGLSLMATGNHKYLSIGPGDKVVLSSKSIPGNEKLICNIINLLIGLGAEVLYEKIARVHVSGHGQEEELRKMLSLTRPCWFVPIHGERRHLARHLRLAQGMGVPPERTLLVEDGESLTVTPRGVERGERVPSGRVFVDGKGVGEVGDLVLRDRIHLSRDGLLIALLAINRSDGSLIGEVELFSRGFVNAEEEELLEGARGAVRHYLDEARTETKTDWSEVEAEVRALLRRYFKKRMGRRPVVIPIVMEL